MRNKSASYGPVSLGMRASTFALVLAAIALLLTPVCAAGPAGYTLTNGNSTVTIDPMSPTGMNSWVVDGINQLAEQWWYYRIGDTRAAVINALGDPSALQLSANTLTITYTGLYANMTIKYVLTGGPGGSGTSIISEQVWIKNDTAAVLPFHLYEYTDLNLNDTAYDDRAALLNPSTIGQWDGAIVSTESAAVGGITPPPNHWEVADAQTLADKLNSGSSVVLADASTPFVGDAAFSFQWDFSGDGSIPALGTQSLSKLKVLMRGGAIGDTVWYDSNGDGIKDSAEPGILGVKVTLAADFNRDGTVDYSTSTTTDQNGYYLFPNLPAGRYTITLDKTTLPSGVVQTFDYDGIATPDTATVDLMDGEVNLDVDFGYWQLASVGDRVWNDLNGNGVQDAGESGINGVTVVAKDTVDGSVVGTAVTAGDGIYQITGLKPGVYSIIVDNGSLPGGMTQTFDLDGYLDHSTIVTLAAGDNRTDADFGYWRPASLGDRVWIDANGDKTQDTGEAGINGVTVNLKDSGGSIIATTVTAGDGIYHFTNLAAGTYTVSVDANTLPLSMIQTYDLDQVLDNSTTVTIVLGDNRTDLDFGYRFIFVDQRPGILLVKTGPATASVGDSITYHFTVTNTGDTDLDITVNDPLLGGIIWQKAAVAPGEVNEFDANYVVKATDLTLKFTSSGTRGVMCVTPNPPPCPPPTSPAYVLVNTATATGVAPSGENVTSTSSCTTDITAPVGSIGDRVWNDLNANGVQDVGEPGINGVKLILRNGVGNIVGTTITSGDGTYHFTSIPAGAYSVTVSPFSLPSGMQETYELDHSPNGTTLVTLAAGENRTDADFGYVANRPRICLVKTGPATASVGDTITYHFKVTNTGNTVLNIVVNDPLLGGVIWQKAGVAPGAVNEFDRTYVVNSDSCGTRGMMCFTPQPPQCPTPDPCVLVNTAKATGISPLGGRVSSESSCTTTIVKPANYTTYTQGGWGARPNGANPGALLQSKFYRVYPNGCVMIGGNYKLKFYGASAIRDFLPQGGRPGMLRCSLVNPTTSPAGVFAGQVLALRLNVDFSNAGVTAPGLGSLRLRSGPLAGRTIAQVLAIAEQVLGGNASALPPGMSISQLNDIVDGINNSYDR